MEVLKVKSLLLLVIGSEKNIYEVCVCKLGQLKKVMAADFSFSKQIGWGIWTQLGGGGDLNKLIFKSSNAGEVAGRGRRAVD